MEPVAIIAQNFPKIVLPLISNAKHSIRVITFDWRWYSPVSGSPVGLFNVELIKAKARGVDVRCLVNNDEVVSNLNSAGCKARKINTKKLLHTKMILIDDCQLIIGSHNLTHNAFCMNEEASVFVTLSNPQNDFSTYFDALYGL